MKPKPFLLLVERADGWHVRTRTPDGKLVGERITIENAPLVTSLLTTTVGLAAVASLGAFKASPEVPPI